MGNVNVVFGIAFAAMIASCSSEGSATPISRGSNAAGALGRASTAGTERVSDTMSGAGRAAGDPGLIPSASSAGRSAPLVPVSAAGARASDGQCGAVMQSAENKLQPVDIIFSIDTSGSMRDEIGFVKENMNAFSKQIRDSGIDVHVILIAAEKTGMEDPFGGLIFTDGVCIDAPLGSGQCPADSNPPGYVHVNEVIGQWNILDAYITTYSKYKQYLRVDSLKTFVSVSDTDASTSADKFVADLKALEPNSPMWSTWRYCGIYPFDACGGVGPAMLPGAVHADLVSRTQGVGGDLCKQDFAPVFDEIAKKLVDVAQLACDWTIPPPPSGDTFDPMKTNVQLSVDDTEERLLKTPTAADCGTREGWHYDDEGAPKRVVVCPTTCARIQAAIKAEVKLLFGCSTQILPM